MTRLARAAGPEAVLADSLTRPDGTGETRHDGGETRSCALINETCTTSETSKTCVVVLTTQRRRGMGGVRCVGAAHRRP